MQTQRGNVRHCARKMRFVCPQSAGTGFTPSWKQFQAFVQSDAEVCVSVRWSRDTDEPLHPLLNQQEEGRGRWVGWREEGKEGVEASIIPLCGVSSLGNGARGSVRKLVK